MECVREVTSPQPDEGYDYSRTANKLLMVDIASNSAGLAMSTCCCDIDQPSGPRHCANKSAETPEQSQLHLESTSITALAQLLSTESSTSVDATKSPARSSVLLPDQVSHSPEVPRSGKAPTEESGCLVTVAYPDIETISSALQLVMLSCHVFGPQANQPALTQSQQGHNLQ